jgi:hypothetical protein
MRSFRGALLREPGIQRRCPRYVTFKKPNAGRIAAGRRRKGSKKRSDQSSGSSFTIEAP